jgi:hypothetical protein
MGVSASQLPALLRGEQPIKPLSYPRASGRSTSLSRLFTKANTSISATGGRGGFQSLANKVWCHSWKGLQEPWIPPPHNTEMEPSPQTGSVLSTALVPGLRTREGGREESRTEKGREDIFSYML